MLANEWSDVLGVHLLARHHPKQPGFLAEPVRGQFCRHLSEQVPCLGQVAPIDGPHRVAAEVDGTFVFGDVVTQ